MDYHFGHQAGTPAAQPAPGYGPQRPEQLAGLEQLDLRIDHAAPQRRERMRTRQRTMYTGGVRGHATQFPAKRTGLRKSQVALASLLLASVIALGTKQVLQKRAAAGPLRKGWTQPMVEQARTQKAVKKATVAAEAETKAVTEIPWLQFAAQYWPVLISLYSPLLALVVSVVTFTISHVNRGGRDDLNLAAYMPLISTASSAVESAWRKIDQEIRGVSEEDEDR